MQTPAGHLLARASEIRAATELGFTLTLDDVTVLEYRALQVVENEKRRAERRNGRKIPAKNQ